MSRTTVHMSILATILISAHLMGLIQDTGTIVLLSWITNPGSFDLTLIFSTIESTIAAIGTAATSTIVAGLVISRRVDLAIFVSIASLFLLIGWDIIAIYNGIAAINSDIALIVVSVAMFSYSVTVLDWWRGTG